MEFTRNQWKCNRCGKLNRVRKIRNSGEHLRTCKCGRTMHIKIEMESIITYRAIIVGLRDSYRRCNRGTPPILNKNK